MKRKIILGVAAVAVALLLSGGVGLAEPIWQQFWNVFVKHQLRVDGAADFNAAVNFDSTVTKNATDTAAGNVEWSSPSVSFEAGFLSGTTSIAITGLTLGDTGYYCLFEPTANVTPLYITSRTSTGFTIVYVASADVTGRGSVIHY